MEDGRLLVVTGYDPETHQAMAHLYSENGTFICQTSLPKTSFSMLGGQFRFQPKLVFRHQQAYILEETELSEFALVRYSYALKKPQKNLSPAPK